MTGGHRTVLLDITRLIAWRWTGRQPTGIDRVCRAYLDHYRDHARGVVQHRGVVRVLSAPDSKRLFAMLLSNAPFRTGFMRIAVHMFARSSRRIEGNGAFYINVGHTDFDLPTHHDWIAECRLRSVYLLHDLIPILHPQFCTQRAARRHRGRVAGAMRHAAGIIANSRATALDLEHFAANCGLRVPPLLPVHLGAGGLPTPANETTHGVQVTDPYFICVGTIERRKNHPMLFEVWQRLHAKMGTNTPRLVIKGQAVGDTQAVLEQFSAYPQLHPIVSFDHHCSDADLENLVSSARAVLMPSRAEGFGIPLIETLALGTPVLASALPAFREIGQGIPDFLDPDDIAAWERAVTAYCGDDGQRRAQLDRLKGFRPYRWDEHFSVVDRWLLALASGTPATSKSRPIAMAS